MKTNISHLTTGVLTLTGANAAGLVEINLLDNFFQSGTGGSDSFSSQFIPGGTFSNILAGSFFGGYSAGAVNPGTNYFKFFHAGTVPGVGGIVGVAIGNSYPNIGRFEPANPFFSGLPQAGFDGSQYYVRRRFGLLNGVASGPGPGYYTGTTPQTLSGFVTLNFSHNLINGGQQTAGLVQIEISNINQTSHRIEAQRLIFEDVGATGTANADVNTLLLDNLLVHPSVGPQLLTTSTELTEFGTVENGVLTVVPEPSSVALLALGAGGLITRRRRESKKNTA